MDGRENSRRWGHAGVWSEGNRGTSGDALEAAAEPAVDVTSASAGERHQHSNAVETGQNCVKKEKIKVLAKTQTQAEDHK